MRILLDTQYLMWAVDTPARLPASIRDVLEYPGNAVLFSAVSIWEIAIKATLRRADFVANAAVVARGAIAAGFTERVVAWPIAASVCGLAAHHGDPFDRLLIAQALAEPARLLTADRTLAAYSDLIWVVPPA